MKAVRGFTLIELIITIAIIGILAAVFLSGGGDDSVGLYGWLKSKDVSGRLTSVTSAASESGVLSNNASVAFSSAVVVKTADGTYVTFSSNDRQWAALRGTEGKDKCVIARVYPYPPWSFSKAGTYHAGRLLTLSDCKS